MCDRKPSIPTSHIFLRLPTADLRRAVALGLMQEGAQVPSGGRRRVCQGLRKGRVYVCTWCQVTSKVKDNKIDGLSLALAVVYYTVQRSSVHKKKRCTAPVM